MKIEIKPWMWFALGMIVYHAISYYTFGGRP